MDFKGQIKLFIFIVAILAMCVYLRLFVAKYDKQESVPNNTIEEVEVIKETTVDTTTTKKNSKKKNNKKSNNKTIIAGVIFEDIEKGETPDYDCIVKIEQEEYIEEKPNNIETNKWESYDPIVDAVFDPINIVLEDNVKDEVDVLT